MSKKALEHIMLVHTCTREHILVVRSFHFKMNRNAYRVIVTVGRLDMS